MPKIFQRQSDEVRIARLGYWNPSVVFQIIVDCSFSHTWQTAYEYI